MPSSRKTVLHRRQEGFPGQQIAVATPSIFSFLNESLIDGFIPTAAGYFPRAQGHYVKRTTVISDAIFLLCIEGAGWLEVGETRLELCPGDVGFIPAHQLHAYGAHAEKPWSVAWFHVNGPEVERVAAILALSQSSLTCQVGAIEKDLPLIDELCQLLRPPNQLAQMRIASLLVREWFARAAERQANASHGASLVDRMQISIKWMRSNLHRPIRLVDLAGQAQLSVSRYSEVFRQLYGRPPIDFCTACRIGIACEQLATTQLKVSVIAETVGYTDALHFSRVFRREMGYSPSKYRKTQGHNSLSSVSE
ncbi:MAG: helix-turn-helix domain-containing protein [Phycisphaeraceae bacterium]